MTPRRSEGTPRTRPDTQRTRIEDVSISLDETSGNPGWDYCPIDGRQSASNPCKES